MRRNLYIAERKAKATSLNMVSAFNKEEITHFYKMLSGLMENHRFPPYNIYNADKTGITTVIDTIRGACRKSPTKSRSRYKL